MRPLSRGLLLSPLLCSALLFVPAGAAAAAVGSTAETTNTVLGGTATTTDTASHDTARTTGRTAELVAQRLGELERADHRGVLTPLLDALDALTTTDGRLDTAHAAGYAQDVRTAHTAVQRRLADLADHTGAVTPEAAAQSTPRAAAADPVSDFLASLQSTVDALLKGLTSLDLGAILGAVTGLLSPVLGLVTGLLGGGVPEVAALPAAGSPATAR